MQYGTTRMWSTEMWLEVDLMKIGQVEAIYVTQSEGRYFEQLCTNRFMRPVETKATAEVELGVG